ncbi:MAG: homoserine kinase, partial [Acidimicrobiales bacterium]
VAAGTDGHADNAAAACTGGLIAVNAIGDGWRVSKLPLDPGLAFVAVIPDRPLETARARESLPAEVPRADAVFNLGRLALLIEGLGDRRRLSPQATGDRLHQGPRTPLFPEAPELLGALERGGARAACWSGAGPTLLGICDGRDARRVADAGRGALAGTGLAGRVLELHADVEGLVVGERARARPRLGR